VAARRRVGDWEADTMLGASLAGPCVLTLVERKTGYVALRKLRIRRAAELNAHAIRVFPTQPRPVYTVTVDNGTEFHEYAKLEQATATRFYFATPHHAGERGTNENTNGLLRQYLPKRRSMARLTQLDCHRIAAQLNRRPRKRLGYRTPEECYVP
jgi:IS30 family transposase